MHKSNKTPMNSIGLFHFGLLLGLLAVGTFGGCRGDRQTPQDQIRTLIQSAAVAAEHKDLGTLRALLSDRYADDHGQDKRAIEGLLRLQFLRNESLHLYTHIRSVNLPQPDRAQATVLVAMAGVPIKSTAELPALRADLHRFDIDFALENKTWRVQRAAWQRAEPADFLGP